MTTKLAAPMRVLFWVIPIVFIVGSIISSCSTGPTACNNTVPVANQADCNTYSQTYQCSGATFDGTNCNATNCQTCTCNGDVTSITDQQTCLTYASNNQCLNASIENGVCFVSGCLNCEIIVDDSDFITDVDDGGFFI